MASQLRGEPDGVARGVAVSPAVTFDRSPPSTGAGLAALVTVLAAGVALSPGLVGLRPAWAPHLLLILLGVGAFVLPRRGAGGGPPSERPLVEGALAGAGLAWLAALVWSLFVVLDVSSEAERVAQGRPYCLQAVDSRTDYIPVRTRLDLSGLTMRTRSDSGMAFSHHAVLVVKGAQGLERHHWSYRLGEFRAGVLGDDSLPVRCLTTVGFVDDLPLFIAPAPRSDFIRVGERRLLIPAAYRARINNEGRYLTLNALAPDFEPARGPVEVLDRLHLEYGMQEWLDGGLISSERLHSLGVEHGLTVVRPEQPAGTEARYYRELAGPHLRTSIRCGKLTDARPLPCYHRFMREGAMVSFADTGAAAPNWRETQARVDALLDGFEAAGRAADP